MHKHILFAWSRPVLGLWLHVRCPFNVQMFKRCLFEFASKEHGTSRTSCSKLISAGDNWTSTLKSDHHTFQCSIKMYYKESNVQVVEWMYQHPTHFLFPGTVASPQWRIDGCNHCAWPNHGGQSPQGSPGAAIAHHFEEWVEQGAHPIAETEIQQPLNAEIGEFEMDRLSVEEVDSLRDSGIFNSEDRISLEAAASRN